MTEEEILLLIDNKDWAAVKKAVSEMNTVDAAELLRAVADANIVIIFRLLSKDDAADNITRVVDYGVKFDRKQNIHTMVKNCR